MKLIPAVDIMDGQVVRLTKGDEKKITRYKNLGQPFEAAQFWCSQGAELLHIVDLDGALCRGSNLELVKSIINDLDVPVQTGGGIRNSESARDLLESGAYRIVLGSMAMTSPHRTSKLLKEYGEDRIVVALDHRHSKVLLRGWKETTKKKIEKALVDFTEMGFKWFLVTDADRDGAMEGPDIETYNRLSRYASVIASGGVRSLGDLGLLKDSGVSAIIIGKALYEQRFTLPEATRYLEEL